MPKFIEYCKSRTGENSPQAKFKKKSANKTWVNDRKRMLVMRRKRVGVIPVATRRSE
jgi:hypothetical protein